MATRKRSRDDDDDSSLETLVASDCRRPRRRPKPNAKNDVAGNAMVEGLKIFQSTYGHLSVARDDKHDGRSLGIWVMEQRNAFRESKLTSERQEKLRALGLDLDPLGLVVDKARSQRKREKENDRLVNRGN